MMTPDFVNTVQWTQSVGYARQVCARMFRDGQTPADALRAFDLAPAPGESDDWAKTVDVIAQTLCAQPANMAA